MPEYKGACYCGEITYSINIDSPDAARTSLCHCGNCRRFTGGAYGITTKLPASAFKITSAQQPQSHDADNGSGSMLHREFCPKCGSGILEVGEKAKGDLVYVFWGTMNTQGREAMPPKGEFFTKLRAPWLSPVDGLFQKKEIMS